MPTSCALEIGNRGPFELVHTLLDQVGIDITNVKGVANECDLGRQIYTKTSFLDKELHFFQIAARVVQEIILRNPFW